MTKAAYDAVGDKFRSLWGKEAGWAHSVLFTADLRAFSERLSAKAEVVYIKREGATTVLAETQVKAEILTPVSIKSEFEEDKKHMIAVEEVATKQIKRRRKA